MGISWIVALKAVPWVDLVQAAPGIVRGARRLFDNVRADRSAASPESPADTDAESGTLASRLSALEAELASIDAEQEAGSEIIRNLAEQNARLVDAVNILQARVRILLGLTLACMVAVIVLASVQLTR